MNFCAVALWKFATSCSVDKKGTKQMSKLVELYVTEVSFGRLALKDVPSKLRQQVEKALEEEQNYDGQK